MAKKIVVIGAGVGGLSAACRLQHEGFDVTVYEKTSQPDGKDPADYIELYRLNPMMEVYFNKPPAYRHYKIGNDLTDLTRLVEAKGKEKAVGFFEYLAAIYKRYRIALDHFITKPFRNKRDFYNLPTLINALRLKTFDSAEKMMVSFMPDEDPQRMLSFQTLYIGILSMAYGDGFAASFAVTALWLFHLNGHEGGMTRHPAQLLLIAFFSAVVTSFNELTGENGCDNLTVPMGSALTAYTLYFRGSWGFALFILLVAGILYGPRGLKAMTGDGVVAEAVF